MADVAESADQLAHEVTTSPEATAREQVPPKEAGNVAPPVLDPVEQPKNSKDASGCPHVFVTGDLAELQLVHWHDKLPDHSDANMAPYRRLKGFTRRVTAGGAWLVASYVRAALRDVWRIACDAPISSQSILINETFAKNLPFDWWSCTEGDRVGSQKFAKSLVLNAAPNDRQTVLISGDTNEKSNEVPTGYSKFTSVQGFDYDDPRSPMLECVFDDGIVAIDLKSHGEAGGEAMKKPSYVPIGMVTSMVRNVLWARWTRPIVIAPMWKKISLAVRILDDKDLFADKDRKKPRPWHEVRDNMEQDNKGNLLGPLIQFLSNPPNETSAAVLILCENWKDIAPRDVAGYFLFPREQKMPGQKPGEVRTLPGWKIWTSHSNIGIRPQVVEPLESDDDPEYWFHQSHRENRWVWEDRCLREFVGATRGVANFQDSVWIAFPITHEVARVVQPNRRPVDLIASPCAYVSTVRAPHPELRPDLKSTPDVVRPIWDVTLDRKDDGRNSKGIFRLSTPNGYDFPSDWFLRQQQKFDEWIKSHGDQLASHFAFDTKKQKHERCVEWSLSRFHTHRIFTPEWTLKSSPMNGAEPKLTSPGINREFEHVVFTDLNFGFRRHPEEADVKNPPPISVRLGMQIDQMCNGEDQQHVYRPDWWYPLLKWASVRFPPSIAAGFPFGHHPETVSRMKAKEEIARSEKQWDGRVEESLKKRGWIIGILGRQLPLRELVNCEDCDTWADDDLWAMLRKAEVKVEVKEDKKKSTPQHVALDANIAIGPGSPLFRDRTIVILSGHLLRASGARISYRLSWEQTAQDCLRELESNPKLKPLLDFRHVVIRFGCVGAVHLSRRENVRGVRVDTSALFYDATAKESYFRDPEESGRVIGSNSTFAARIMQSLIERGTSEERDCDCDGESDEAVKSGIRRAILDCQELYKMGYGNSFNESDPHQLDLTAQLDVLFSPKPVFQSNSNNK